MSQFLVLLLSIIVPSLLLQPRIFIHSFQQSTTRQTKNNNCKQTFSLPYCRLRNEHISTVSTTIAAILPTSLLRYCTNKNHHHYHKLVISSLFLSPSPWEGSNKNTPEKRPSNYYFTRKLLMMTTATTTTTTTKMYSSFHEDAENTMTHTNDRKQSKPSRQNNANNVGTEMDQLVENSISSNNINHVVIAGAGIMGLCTAYYLVFEAQDDQDNDQNNDQDNSKNDNNRNDNYKNTSGSRSIQQILPKRKNRPKRITIIDPSGVIAPAASGKAGGFLALNWNDGSFTQELTRRSFVLHQQLANQLGYETINYRRATCVSISTGNKNVGTNKPQGKKLDGIEWVHDATSIRSLGTEDTIAQVHPNKLCQRLWEILSSTTETGGTICELIQGTVVGPCYNTSSLDRTDSQPASEKAERNNNNMEFGGCKLENGSVITCNAIVYACGPWTSKVIPSIPMVGIKYHSVVVPTSKILQQCVFFSGHGDPEVYVRPDQTAYLTGFPERPIYVQDIPGKEQVVDSKIEAILQSVKECSGSNGFTRIASTDTSTTSSTSSINISNNNFEEEELVMLQTDQVLVKQACYLPSTADDGIPVIGSINENEYIVAGHSCWGILLGPASGEAISSLILSQWQSKQEQQQEHGNQHESKSAVVQTAPPRTLINLQKFSPKRYIK